MARKLHGVYAILGIVSVLATATDVHAQGYRSQPQGLSNSGIVQQLMNSGPGSDRNVNTASGAQRNAGAAYTQSATRVPQYNGVRQASYEMPAQTSAEWPAVRSESLSGMQHGAAEDSFIERERSVSSTSKSGGAETITKIAINLAFVLVMAVGCILAIRHWQKNRVVAPTETPAQEGKSLNVSQVLKLGNGVCIHVVDGPQNQFLVAVDSSGVKSVNVIAASFEDSLDMAKTRSRADEQRDSETRAERRRAREKEEREIRDLATQQFTYGSRSSSAYDEDREYESERRNPVSAARIRLRPLPPREVNQIDAPSDDESTSEIDEKLIKMLLNRSKEAA